MAESTLTTFGPTFQQKVLASLLTNQKFLQVIHDILEPVYFDSDANKWLAKVIRDYFVKYKVTPTLEVLKIEIQKVDSDVRQTSIIAGLKEVWQHRKSTDLEFIQAKVLDFCRNQVLKQAIIDSVQLIEDGNYDGVKVKIDTAMKAGVEKDLGHIYKEGIEERLTQSARTVIATPWDSVNALMDGGLGKGELGVIVAAPGIGKCVGGSTEIEIQYDKIGFKINNEITMWFDPWDLIDLDDNRKITAYSASVLLTLTGIDKTL